MGGYRPTIGLEIHAELKTATKMFCNSKNDPDEGRPNTNICPVCLAHPGTLPTINRAAVEHVLRVGTAVGGTIADYTEFDRKNYFYPDIPKGFQISQYAYPLVTEGTLAGVAITRVHLEEDTATSKHKEAASLVDFNRAGLPLMELVTEPVIHDAATAAAFARELQLLLRTLGAGDANMEKGQMRVEANISVSRDATLGTKVEVKNLNSFRSVERAVAFEIERQIAALDSGTPLVQETRGFNEVTGETFSQRLKESSHDYRYFPEPDIPKLRLSLIDAFSTDALRKSLPELPWERRARYSALGLGASDVEILISDSRYTQFFESEILAYLSGSDIRLATNYLLTDIRGSEAGVAELTRLAPGSFASLIRMVGSRTLSSRGAKDVLRAMLMDGGDPDTIAKALGVIQDSSSENISRVAEKLIQDNPKVVLEIQSGKQEALKFLIGLGMKLTSGSANPELLRAELEKQIFSHG